VADRIKKIPPSRLGRASRIGGVAAGHAVRSLGTRAANLTRSEDARAEATRRRHLETADRIVTVLGSMKGAAMKLGQTFSVLDVGMVPEDFRDDFQAKLAKLQAAAEPRPFKEMRRVVEQDLEGRLGEFFSDFGEEPIAAASIGQVYRATLRDGRDVAVKVQYPQIKDIVRADLQNLGLILKLLARISPGLDTKEIADEVRTRIAEELDYELEAANHRALAREYRGHPFIVVPDVVTDLCRERVIVTRFVEGRRFDVIRELPEADRSRFAEIQFRFYINGPFRHRLLNGDPHPGNSLFLADGRAAFLDFGFFKRVSPAELDVQLAVLRAVYERDEERLWAISVEQGIFPATAGADAAERLMRLYRVLCGWFMEDVEVTITPDVATAAILEHSSLRGAGFQDITLPADQIVAARASMLVLAILGQLRATNNWYRIGREETFGDPPATELGRVEVDWLASRGV
jgi:predicted unusual protein kinase regulating ubiquinone biosynthesis (AarF/ABC1/UbiB family)